jgi:hypothetical protein
VAVVYENEAIVERGKQGHPNVTISTTNPIWIALILNPGVSTKKNRRRNYLSYRGNIRVKSIVIRVLTQQSLLSISLLAPVKSMRKYRVS